ncbi:hypothetical protein M9458_007661, partial [Cirrhinus mrigala]
RHVVDTSHKDTDNATQPQQALLMDTIPAEPCPQSSSQTDCDVRQGPNPPPSAVGEPKTTDNSS